MAFRWLENLRELFTREREDDDLAREVRSHLDEETEEQIDRGVPPEEAPYAARRAFGNVTRVEERTREAWRGEGIASAIRELAGGVVQDARYGLKGLIEAADVHDRGRPRARARHRRDHHDLQRHPERPARSVSDVPQRRSDGRHRDPRRRQQPARRARLPPDRRVPGIPGADDVVRRGDCRRRRRLGALRRSAGGGAAQRRVPLRQHLRSAWHRRAHRPDDYPRRRQTRRAAGLRHELQTLGEPIWPGSDARRQDLHARRRRRRPSSA